MKRRFTNFLKLLTIAIILTLTIVPASSIYAASSASAKTTESTTSDKTTNTSKISNKVSITSENGGDIDITSDSVDTVVTDAKLSITKSCQSEDVRVGSNLTYVITITNSGTGEARDVVVEDNFNSEKSTFVSATESKDSGIIYELSGGKITWTISEIEAGGSVELILVVEVNEKVSVGTMVSNSASVISENNKEVKDVISNTISTIVVAPSLSISESVDKTTVRSGDTLTYTITVSNTGDTGRDIHITDELPKGLTFASASDDGKYFNGVVTWVVDTLEKDSTKVLTLTVTVD